MPPLAKCSLSSTGTYVVDHIRDLARLFRTSERRNRAADTLWILLSRYYENASSDFRQCIGICEDVCSVSNRDLAK